MARRVCHARTLRRASTWLAVAAVAAAGCDAPPYNLAPVAGVVTLDGAPVPGAVVNFQPQAASGSTPGPGSTGRCDATGRFELQTIRGAAGAVVGAHRVRIYSYSPESPKSGDTDDGSQQEIIPTRYNYESELTFAVPAGGSRAADFALNSAVP